MGRSGLSGWRSREPAEGPGEGVTMMATEKSTPTDDEIYELGTICTRDEAGRHFTEGGHGWQRLEELGLIQIHRPIHDGTGIPYSQEHWSLEVTEAGQEIVDAEWSRIEAERHGPTGRAEA